MLYSKTPAAEKRRLFRERLASGELLRFPGAFNPLSARMIEQKGFDGVYISGAVLSARFDAAIDAAVQNDYLTQALRPIRAHLARARRLARDNAERLHQSVVEHALIAEAIAARDPDLAAHATHVHLHHALTSILGAIDGAPSTDHL